MQIVALHSTLYGWLIKSGQTFPSKVCLWVCGWFCSGSEPLRWHQIVPQLRRFSNNGIPLWDIIVSKTLNGMQVIVIWSPTDSNVEKRGKSANIKEVFSLQRVGTIFGQPVFFWASRGHRSCKFTLIYGILYRKQRKQRYPFSLRAACCWMSTSTVQVFFTWSECLQP